ncbi:hypothetical protein ACFX4N_24505 [Priestia sp. YIM B13551]|uniref:hypothetical protein n=1 Tax=Priestia sp. YIM B13551 TaxID=3366306 RepID=UPI00366CB0D9
MNPIDLTNMLGIGLHNEDEILIVLQEAFPFTVQSDTYELKMYCHESHRGTDSYALICKFRKARRNLYSIETGPGFPKGYQKEIKKTIERDLKKDTKHIGNMIIFSRIPVKNPYLCRDYFQILPLSDEEKKLHEHFMYFHPFRVQFKFYNSPNTSVRMSRCIKKGNEIELLLSLFLNTPISNQYLKKVNFYISDVETDWETSPEGLEPMVKFTSKDYYSTEEYPHHSVQLPEMFNSMFNRFYLLDSKLQERFLRAAYWFKHAGEVTNISRSASFLAFISAIETMASDKSKLTECKECKNKAGATQQVRKFLEDNLQGEPQKIIKKMYNLRSNLTHGSMILQEDSGTFMPMTPSSNEEFYDYNLTKKLTRTSLINWLGDQKNKNKS